MPSLESVQRRYYPSGTQGHFQGQQAQGPDILGITGVRFNRWL